MVYLRKRHESVEVYLALIAAKTKVGPSEMQSKYQAITMLCTDTGKNITLLCNST